MTPCIPSVMFVAFVFLAEITLKFVVNKNISQREDFRGFQDLHLYPSVVIFSCM